MIIDSPNGSQDYRILIEDGLVLDKPTLEAVHELMVVGKAFADAQVKLKKLLPDGTNHQFFGNWDCLRIKKWSKDAYEMHGI